MNRALRVGAAAAVIGIVLFAIWAVLTRSVRRSGTIHSEITNAVHFAKNHFTGGVGAVLTADRATGFPLIQKIMAGSPAEKAGLREGDRIMKVDGVATSGRTLAQNVDSIRGFAAGSVTLTIQRNGSTNLQYVIHRGSWKSLGIPQ